MRILFVQDLACFLLHQHSGVRVQLRYPEIRCLDSVNGSGKQQYKCQQDRSLFHSFPTFSIRFC